MKRILYVLLLSALGGMYAPQARALAPESPAETLAIRT